MGQVPFSGPGGIESLRKLTETNLTKNAEIGQESRERAYIAMLQVTDDLPGATTKALLGNLARQIKLIDTDKDHAPVARDVAASVMLELCNRYKIKLT